MELKTIFMDHEAQRKLELAKILNSLTNQRDKSSNERIKELEHLQITAASHIDIILIELLKTEDEPNVLLHVCNMLARRKVKDSTDIILDILLGQRLINGEKDPINTDKNNLIRVRCSLIKALGKMKDHKALGPLMQILNDKNEHYKVRLMAAEALGNIGDPYAVTPLINLVSDEKEKSVYVRESAAVALGMLGDVRAIKPLVKILESKRGIFDKFTFLKERAIEAISKLGGSRDGDVIKVLKESLIDEAPSVRLSAVEALGTMADPRFIPILLPAIYDEEEDVAREAVRSIYNLEGQLELSKLLDKDDLPGWARDEIETVFQEE